MVQKRSRWQDRVERVNARRQENKQRKQKSEYKKLFKAWLQEMTGMLDRQHDTIQRRSKDKKWVFHLWASTLPADGPPLLDVLDTDDKAKRKPRSASIESEGSGRKARGRSNSINEAKGSAKKKVHPRSRPETTPETVEEPLPTLCRSYFFTNKCAHGKGCRHLHPSSNNLTLCKVLGASADSKKELSLSEAAHNESISEDHELLNPGSMSMVYYISFSIADLLEAYSFLGEALCQGLLSKQIPMASVVYISFNDTLIYDRYQEGLLFTDREFIEYALGETIGRRISVGTDEEDVKDDLFHLNGVVLEHILTYLPDASVAVSSQVCKSWNQEIGRNSPNLWKHMLDRRRWPLPDENAIKESSQQVYRKQFLQHYGALRDMIALKSATEALITRQVAVEREMTYQDFSKRKHSPAYPNGCVSIQNWSPNHILVAYSQDCSLRLFESVPVSGSKEARCKELVCQRIDPYRKTKRRTCKLVSMGIDEDLIGCLCHVMADNVDAEAYILVVLSRDEFLLAESSAVADFGAVPDDAEMTVIDIGEAVLNYILSCDEADHRTLQVIDFLSDGGEVGEIEVLASQSIAACGHGRFMVEVSISIPVDQVNAEGDVETSMHLVDRKLVLFSSNAGAIVWVGESNPLDEQVRPRHEDMTLAYIRQPRPGGSRAVCALAVASTHSMSVTLGEIEASGHIQIPQVIISSVISGSELIQHGWVPVERKQRPIIVTSSTVILADALVKFENEKITRRTILSFLYRTPTPDGKMYRTLTLDGEMEVVRISSLRDEHVVVLCRKFSAAENSELGDVTGHWFGDNNQLTNGISVYAVIVHIESHREIGRVCLVENASDFSVVPHLTVVSDDTVGMGLSWLGVAMTGSCVRSVCYAIPDIVLSSSQKSGKKKKKGRAKKNSKKDFFARGMSLTG